ncbi:MAG: hypothetical protein RLZZ271_1240, partial [Pseudomonadota bacterium]
MNTRHLLVVAAAAMIGSAFAQ